MSRWRFGVMLASVAGLVGFVATGPADAAGRNTIPRHDRNGDGRADVGVIRFEGNNIRWFWNHSSGGFDNALFGSTSSSDRIVSGDFDGDGRMDPAVWRPGSPSTFFVLRSSTGQVVSFPFGQGSSDDPVEGDFDGDGRSDFAVVRYVGSGQPLTWFIQPSGGGATIVRQFGQTSSIGGPSDIPMPADYDGDGRTDIAVARATFVNPVPSNGPNVQWIVARSSGGFSTTTFGQGFDDYTTGDVNGDGRDDIVIMRTTGATKSWFVHTGSGVLPTVVFGASSDRPFVDDVDGDGRVDFGVARFGGGPISWFYRRSSSGAVDTFTFGANTDLPLSTFRNATHD